MHRISRVFGQICAWNIRKEISTGFSGRNVHLKAEDAREIRIPLPYGQIAGKEWGNLDGYPIICLHGFADNCESFTPLAPLLSDRFRYIALDAVAHGLTSTLPPGMFIFYWEAVVHLLRASEHFGLSKFSILGHSWGASTGLLYASLYPEAVDRIFALDFVKPVKVPFAWHTQDKGKAIKLQLELEKKLKDDTKSYTLEELARRYVTAMGGAISPEAVRILLRRGARPSGTGFVFSHDPRIMMPSVIKISVEEQREIIQKGLRCHLKIVKAREGPLYEAAEVLEEFKGYYRAQCASFQYEVLEGTHHFHMHNPERLAPIINEFFSP